VGIREKLNDNPAYTTGGTIAIIVIALVFIVWQIVPSHPSFSNKEYYSDDDGASYFADDMNKIAPFDHGGKQAVKCHVYKCSSSGKFVGYLEKFNPVAKQRLDAAASKPGPPDPSLNMLMMTGTLVKKPGPGPWISIREAQKFQSVVNVTCPNGGSDLEAVTP